jgi:hypothetical protein
MRAISADNPEPRLIWVNRAGLTFGQPLPVYLGQRTLSDRPGRSVSCQQQTNREADLVPPLSTYIGILHAYGPPSTIDLAHDARTNAGADGLFNVAIDVELGMHHSDVRR